MLPCAQCSREGQGGKKISLSPWPWQECWCPGRLCHGLHTVLVAVLGWQGRECLTMAEIDLFSRDPVPHQISKLGKFGTTSAPDQTWGQAVVQEANLPGCQTFGLLSIETSTALLAPSLCEELPQNATRRQNPARGGTATPHTHRQSTGLGLQRGLA